MFCMHISITLCLLSLFHISVLRLFNSTRETVNVYQIFDILKNQEWIYINDNKIETQKYILNLIIIFSSNKSISYILMEIFKKMNF